MDEQKVELRDVVDVLWRRKMTIVVITVAMTALALGISLRQAPVYQASTRIVLRPVLALDGTSARAATLGLELSAESEAEIIQSSTIAQRVKQALNLDEPAHELASSVDVRLRTTQLMQITTAADTPASAAEIANTFAAEYIRYRRELAASALTDHALDLQERIKVVDEEALRFDERIIELSAELGSLPRGRRAPAEVTERRAELQAEIERLTAERNEMLGQRAGLRDRLDAARNAQEAASGGGEVIEPAAAPESPATPRPFRDGLLGLIFGLMAGIGGAYLREYFDDRIRTEQDARRIGGVPMVGAIPRSNAWRRRKTPFVVTMSDARSASAEAYRTVRQSLVAIGLGKDIRTVHVTSGGPGAGKSATVANLGVVCAQAGMRVIMVSADLRKPRLHAFFGAPNDAGLSEILESGDDPREGLVPTSVPGLSLLPSGPPPENPAGMLDGVHLERVLTALLDVSDIVLIDSPPVSSGADAMVLTSRADLSLVVMRRGSARATGITAALNVLARSGARRLATLLSLAEEPTRTPYPSFEPFMASTFVHVGEGNGTRAMNGQEQPGISNGHVAPQPEASRRKRRTATRRTPSSKTGTTKERASRARSSEGRGME